MNERIIILPPVLCSDRLIKDFIKLANRIEKLDHENIEMRINRCVLLGFLFKDDKLVSIRAIKPARFMYTRRIFKEAGVKEQFSDFSIETGYAYTIPTYRRKGLSKKLFKAMLVKCSNKNIFCTSVINSPHIGLAILLGFRKIGSAFKSSIGNYDVELFVKRNV